MELNAFITARFIDAGLPPDVSRIISQGAVLLFIGLVAWLAYQATSRYLVKIMELASRHSKNTWDDALINRGVVRRFSYLVPIIVVYMMMDLMLPTGFFAFKLVLRLAMILLVVSSVRVFDALLLTVRDIYDRSKISGGRPIRGYTDALKIIVYLLAAIFIIAIVTDKSPWGILSILGGFTVVLMLIFKDTILGFVASIQLTGHDMVRVGDWIEMKKYGADGDVIDVSIHTVKVRNWDKTISTIPTHSLVSDAFKNWRGMSDSGGRRIKRALHIDMNSIRFCTTEMFERFGRYELLKEYLTARTKEIEEYNMTRQIDELQLINGRRQTNIGIFRAYVVSYLRNHPKIHQDMTFLVRQLQPTAQGLPLEIYVFSKDQVWANYEAIQADIFDHLLAAIPEFDLRIFQNPTGHDFKTALLGNTV